MDTVTLVVIKRCSVGWFRASYARVISFPGIARLPERREYCKVDQEIVTFLQKLGKKKS